MSHFLQLLWRILFGLALLPWCVGATWALVVLIRVSVGSSLFWVSVLGGAAAWLVVIGTGLVFAIEPNWTTLIARKLGINRGTDLLLYVLVLAVLQGFLIIYLKLRRVRRELTLLVRELAIREAERSARDERKDA